MMDYGRAVLGEQPGDNERISRRLAPWLRAICKVVRQLCRYSFAVRGSDGLHG